MVDLLLRHRILVLLSLVAILAILAMFGSLVWWATSENAPISAQEMMEDVCASVAYPESFDITVRASGYNNSGSAELLTTYRRNDHAEHYVAHTSDGIPLM